MGRSKEEIILRSLVREIALSEIVYTPDPGGGFEYTGGGLFTRLSKINALEMLRRAGNIALGIGKFVAISGFSLLNIAAMLGVTSGAASVGGWRTSVKGLYDDISNYISGIPGLKGKDLLSLLPPVDIVEPAAFQSLGNVISEGDADCDDVIAALEEDVIKFENGCNEIRSASGPDKISLIFSHYAGHKGDVDLDSYSEIMSGVDPARVDRMFEAYMRRLNKLTGSMIESMFSSSEMKACLPAAKPLIERIRAA